MQTPPPNSHSNYPRYAQQGGNAVPPGPPVVRYAALGEAWNLVKQDMGTWVVAWLMVAIIHYALILTLSFVFNTAFVGNAVSGDPFSLPTGYWVGSFASKLQTTGVITCLTTGIAMMALRRLRGHAVTLADMFEGLKFFVPLLAVSILTQLLTLGGVILLIIPGLWIVGATIFAPLLVMDKNLGILDAIRTSVETLKSHALNMFLLLFVIGLLMIGGLIACCVGILFVLPVYSFAIAIHYHAFFPPSGMQPAYPGYGPAPTQPYPGAYPPPSNPFEPPRAAPDSGQPPDLSRNEPPYPGQS